MRIGAEIVKWAGMAKYRKRFGVALALYRLALLFDNRNTLALRGHAIERRRRNGELKTLRGVIIGTTGLCNASCIHCPTGKASTQDNPRTPMPMPIFRRIIDGIADGEIELTGQIAFGLFGDSLVDPFVVERARYVSEKLPDAEISINTNGAAFNAARHAALLPLVRTVALHCEALDAPTYDRLMTPLRAKNVFPKIEALLKAFPGKVMVSVPVSRANIGDLDRIREWFLGRGADHVTFDSLSSRCADDLTTFNSLALSPIRGSCGADLLDFLVVDCDGTIVACCNDFKRERPIGSLADASLDAALATPTRSAFRDAMAEGRHADISTCARCYADPPFVPAANGAEWAGRATLETV